MTAKKKATTGTGSARKLKLKKETLRDLDVKKGGKAIKGGARPGGVAVLLPPFAGPQH